ncbi:uncharacterized protein LOC124113411 [Haliotis rufescens]|uniref:uncharacterized protein LOC124113411 n=1 Tax=Haliotis rufescens TaxID=6454 RepID=UPI00201EF5B9|nr:uncharacterized protein LOC124113411 [Haliotis rufescens]
MSKLVLAFTLSTALLLFQHPNSTTHAVPLPEEDGRWVNPCGGGAPVSGSLPPLPSLPPMPLGIDLTSLKYESQTAATLTDKITYIIKTRIGSTAAQLLHTSPSLTGFPGTGASFKPGILIEDILFNETKRLSQIGVFLEQARLDTYDYTQKLEGLENKYVEMLCLMQDMLEGLNQEVATDVSRDIMPSEYRALKDISEIDRRNYLIMRDAKQIFVAIAERADAYLQEHHL